MARRRAHIPLNVLLNGRRVGQWRRETGGMMDFRYDDGWLAWEHTMPISFSLPLREERYTGAPVIAVFDNLLPDNDDIRRRLATRVKAEANDAYSLLAAMGRDCVGALQFLPEGDDPGPVGGVSGRPLDDGEIADILSNLTQNPLGIDGTEEFRLSIAGAQEKTALLKWQGQWHVPHGSTATTHILKPAIGKLLNGIDLSQSVENEYLCLRLTAAFGLPTTHAEMQTFADRRVLVVERFDRQWTRDARLLRLPQEDCCQALSVPPPRKYESDGGPGIRAILELLKASDEPQVNQRLFLKAQIVFWLLGATDGHAKNFSFFLSPGGRFRLTPLYDVMSAQPNVDAGQIQLNRMKLAMAVGDKRHYVVGTIAPRHFVQTAAGAGISAAFVQSICHELRDEVPGAIDTALSQLPEDFPPALADSIVIGARRRLHMLRYPI